MNKYLEFTLIAEKPKAKIIVKSKTHPVRLGIIKWWTNWRQYVFLPEKDTLYSAGCLEEIQSYIKGL